MIFSSIFEFHSFEQWFLSLSLWDYLLRFHPLVGKYDKTCWYPPFFSSETKRKNFIFVSSINLQLYTWISCSEENFWYFSSCECRSLKFLFLSLIFVVLMETMAISIHQAWIFELSRIKKFFINAFFLKEKQERCSSLSKVLDLFDFQRTLPMPRVRVPVRRSGVRYSTQPGRRYQTR